MPFNTLSFSQIAAALATAGAKVAGTLASGIDALFTLGGAQGIAFTDNAGNLDQSAVQTLALPTGVTGVTQAPGNGTTKLATTAFVAAATANFPITAPGQAIPTTGQTVTAVPIGPVHVQSINPAGALAALTLAANNGAFDGQIIFFAISQAVTAYTYGANITATAGLALAGSGGANVSFGFVWTVAAAKWTRFL